ncbi:hypothetical protein [Nocardioides terrisoli]|uniref:hypothetical protein n=1 Tax=Nocardioides terrisoli TaxID=3388267 RepID=UPI00287B79CD|nr:hypothetical protein [Nocardioides marmorisolisilvae]
MSVHGVDDLGVNQAPAVRVSGVSDAPLLPVRVTARAGSGTHGYAVIAVPRGRRVWKVEARLDPGGPAGLDAASLRGAGGGRTAASGAVLM